MKRYDNSRFNHDRYKTRQRHNEYKAGGFRCSHCKQFVVINDKMGTRNRNHCNLCLWSRHVDEAKGDRKAICNGGMEPIGLTFKHEGYGRAGELMLIHLCSACPKISINRIARDDPEGSLLGIFSQSLRLAPITKLRLDKAGIYLLSGTDREDLLIQLFGK